MGKEFKRLCDLAAADIDPSRITNRNLAKIICSALNKKNGEFIFRSSRRGHTEEWSTPGHTDSGTGDQHSDFWSDYRDHTEHTEHTDYTEARHSECGYSESSYHTDSRGGHSDYTERSHTDR